MCINNLFQELTENLGIQGKMTSKHISMKEVLKLLLNDKSKSNKKKKAKEMQALAMKLLAMAQVSGSDSESSLSSQDESSENSPLHIKLTKNKKRKRRSNKRKRSDEEKSPETTKKKKLGQNSKKGFPSPIQEVEQSQRESSEHSDDPSESVNQVSSNKTSPSSAPLSEQRMSGNFGEISNNLIPQQPVTTSRSSGFSFNVSRPQTRHSNEEPSSALSFGVQSQQRLKKLGSIESFSYARKFGMSDTEDSMKKRRETETSFEVKGNEPVVLQSLEDLQRVLMAGQTLQINGTNFKVEFPVQTPPTMPEKQEEFATPLFKVSSGETDKQFEMREKPQPKMSKKEAGRTFSDKVLQQYQLFELKKNRKGVFSKDYDCMKQESLEEEKTTPRKRVHKKQSLFSKRESSHTSSVSVSDSEYPKDPKASPDFHQREFEGGITVQRMTTTELQGVFLAQNEDQEPSFSYSPVMTSEVNESSILYSQNAPERLNMNKNSSSERRPQPHLSDLSFIELSMKQGSENVEELSLMRENQKVIDQLYESPANRRPSQDEQLKVEDSESESHHSEEEEEEKKEENINQFDSTFDEISRRVSVEISGIKSLPTIKKRTSSPITNPLGSLSPSTPDSLQQAQSPNSNKKEPTKRQSQGSNSPVNSMILSPKNNKQSGKINCFPSNNSPDQNRSLGVIREEEQEDHSFMFTQDYSDSSSYISDNSKSLSASYRMLPHLKRQTTDNIPRFRPETKDPMMNFIYQCAGAFKLNPNDFLLDQPSPKSSRDDANEGFSQKSFQTAMQGLNENEYEFRELRKNYQKYELAVKKQLHMRRVPSDRSQQRVGEVDPNFLNYRIDANRRMTSNQSKSSYHPQNESLVSETEIDNLRMKIQMNIFSLALRKNFNLMKTLDRDLKEHVNKQTDAINRHEKKVKEFMRNLNRQNKQLHFAFLFACPLVLSCGKVEQEKYKLIPKLDYEKEYTKIKQRLEMSQCQIAITKRQCTTQSFRQVLMRKPLGIHFSGHGILNTYETVGDYHALTKDQGDFLLFETDEGDSQLVSRTQLKNLIATTGADLDFVFVASCHSEFVGRIFLEAGAKHVICIDHRNEVDDNAVVTFTDAFYDAIFSNAANICKAYLNAQVVVSISHNSQQANIFKLLVRDRYLQNHDKANQSNISDPKPAETNKMQSKISPKSSVSSLDIRSNLTFGGGYTSSKSGDSHLSQLTPKSSVRAAPQRSGSTIQLANESLEKSKRKKHVCSNFGHFQKGMFREVTQDVPNLQIGSLDQPIFVARQKDTFKLIQRILSPKSSRLLTLLGLPGIGKSSLVRQTIAHINERALLQGGYIILNVRGIKECEEFLRTLVSKLLAKENKGSFDLFGTVQEKPMQKDNFQMVNLILEKLASIQRKTLLVLDDSEELIKNDKQNFKTLVSYFLNQVPTLKVLLTTRCRLKMSHESSVTEEIMLIHGLPVLQSMLLFSQLSRQLKPKEISDLLKTKPDIVKYPSEKNQPAPKKLQDHHLFRMLGGNPSLIVILAPMLADTEHAMDLVQLYKMLCSEQFHEGEDQMTQIMRQSVHISLKVMKNADPQCLELIYLLALLPGGILARDLDTIWKVHKEKNNDENQSRQPLNVTFQTEMSENVKYEFHQDCKWGHCFLKLQKHKLIVERKLPASDTVSTKHTWMDETILSLPEFVTSFAEAQISSELSEHFTQVLSSYFKNEFVKLYERNDNSLLVTNDPNVLANSVNNKLKKHESNFMAFIQRKIDSQREGSLNINPKNESKIDEVSESSEESEDSGSASKQHSGSVRIKFNKRKLRRIETVGSCPDSPVAQIDTFEKQLNNLIKEKAESKQKLLQRRDSIPSEDEEPTDISSLTPFERAKFRWQNALSLVKMKIQRSKLAKVTLNAGTNNVFESDDGDDEISVNKRVSGLSVSDSETSSKGTIDRKDTMIEEKPEKVQPKENRRASFLKRSGTFNQKTISEVNLVQKAFKQFEFSFKRQNSVKRAMSGKLTISNNDSQSVTDFANGMREDEQAIVYFVANMILVGQYSVTESLIQKKLVFLSNSSNTFMGNIRRMQGLCRMQLLKLQFEKNQQQQQPETQSEFLQKINWASNSFKRAQQYFNQDKNLWGLALTFYQQAEISVFAEQQNLQFQERQERSADDSPSVQISSPTGRKISGKIPLKQAIFGNFADLHAQSLTKRHNPDIAMKSLNDAEEAFEKINHHRGLALITNLRHDLRQYKPMAENFTSFTIHQCYGPNQQADSPMRRASVWSFNTEMSRQAHQQYQKHMHNFREEQRKLKPGDRRHELCITRLQGESMSLAIEIVLGQPNSKGVFEAAQGIELLNEDSLRSIDESNSISSCSSRHMSLGHSPVMETETCPFQGIRSRSSLKAKLITQCKMKPSQSMVQIDSRIKGPSPKISVCAMGLETSKEYKEPAPSDFQAMRRNSSSSIDAIDNMMERNEPQTPRSSNLNFFPQAKSGQKVKKKNSHRRGMSMQLPSGSLNSFVFQRKSDH